MLGDSWFRFCYLGDHGRTFSNNLLLRGSSTKQFCKWFHNAAALSGILCFGDGSVIVICVGRILVLVYISLQELVHASFGQLPSRMFFCKHLLYNLCIYRTIVLGYIERKRGARGLGCECTKG